MDNKGKRWLLVPTWYVLTGLIVLTLVLCAAWLKTGLEDRSARGEIQKRLDAIRASGQPLTAQDLAKLYPDPPPEHDALRLLKPILAALVIPEDSTNLPIFSTDWPAGTNSFEKPVLDEMQYWIGTNQAALGSIPWEKLNGAWIGSGFQNGLINQPEVPATKIYSLAKLLCLDAILEAELRHPEAAVRSLQHALAIESVLKNDTALHGLVKYVIESLVCSSLGRVLNRTPISDSDLAALASSLTATNLGATKIMLIQQRCWGLSVADGFKAAATQTTSHVISPFQWLIRSYEAKMRYRDEDLLNYLDWIDRERAALDQPLSNAIPTLRVMGKSQAIFINQHNISLSFLSYFQKDRVSFLTFWEPDMSRFLETEANKEARVRATLTVIAIERWRRNHENRLPDSLADLTPNFLPSVPIDPFDERPLRYKKAANGYVVYSIGPDFTDNGGKEMPTDETGLTSYDITFTVQR